MYCIMCISCVIRQSAMVAYKFIQVLLLVVSLEKDEQRDKNIEGLS